MLKVSRVYNFVTLSLEGCCHISNKPLSHFCQTNLLRLPLLSVPFLGSVCLLSLNSVCISFYPILLPLGKSIYHIRRGKIYHIRRRNLVCDANQVSNIRCALSKTQCYCRLLFCKIAKNLKPLKLSIEHIKTATGLPAAEIEAL